MPKSCHWNIPLMLLALGCAVLPSRAAEPTVYSGPQAGEKVTGFKVAALQGTDAKERDPVGENKGGPLALVFVHAVERSLAPLLRVIDEYGAVRKDLIQTEVIFLGGDRIAGEQRMKAVQSSLKLKSNVGFSLDGAEGPGNYGLNKECMMTVVVAKGDTVTANFALVQPGIADAPKVVEALAKAAGDTNPPSIEALAPKREMARGGEMRRERAEPSADGAKEGTEGKGPFPGAVPTDEKLAGLLRRFIRPTNDEATVDKVLAEVKEHIHGNDDLRKQAIDGWTRMLHFKDRYGTAYAREKGAELLAELQKQ